jgi:hypothetical protein
MVMSRKMRLVGRAIRTGEKSNTYSVLVRTAEDDDVRGYNIKMNLKDIVWDGMDWNNLVHERDKW